MSQMYQVFPNTELMRSHMGIKWPGGFDFVKAVDLSKLPNREYRLLLLMLSQAGRSDDETVKYEMNGTFQSMYPDAKKAIQELWSRGYFCKLNTEEIVNSLTVKNLRHIAEIVGIKFKSTLKRAEILNAVLPYSNIPTVVSFADNHKWLQLSDKGFMLARSLYAEREALERTIYNLLCVGKEKKAIDTWYAYKSRQFGVAVQGVSKLSVSYVSDKTQRAVLGCYELYGKKPMFYPIKEPEKESVYQRDVGRAKDQIDKYKRVGITKYKSVCVCDSWTCEICASRDGVACNIQEAEIGANCPPFHQGCRCFIAPATD